MSRRSARDTAFRLFYEYSINREFNPATMDVMRDCFDKGMNENAWNYVFDIIEKYKSNREVIDNMIQENSKKWKISHMAKVELSILRLGVCELLYSGDIHRSITINECVELSKKYGADKASKFINGVLAAVVNAIENEPDSAEENQADTVTEDETDSAEENQADTVTGDETDSAKENQADTVTGDETDSAKEDRTDEDK